MILVDMNVKSGITNGWRTLVNLPLTKQEYFSIIFSDSNVASTDITSRNVQMPTIIAAFTT
jgi:hypothetical protein